MNRTAFSLIELCIAVAVVILLVALVLAVRPFDSVRRAANVKYANQLADAVGAYLVRWPRLPDDFAARPYHYLNRSLVRTGAAPLIDPPPGRLLVRAADGSLSPAAREEEATGFRAESAEGVVELVIWVPRARSSAVSRPYTHAVAIWCDGGTPEVGRDDLAATFLVDQGTWTWCDAASLASFTSANGP
jgi:hypothetical protein